MTQRTLITHHTPITHRPMSRPVPRSVFVLPATSMAVEAEPRGMVRPTVPNYVLRRAVAAVAAVVALGFGAVGAVGLLAGFGGTPASAAAAAPAAPTAPTATTAMHVAAPGDTLWSIAGRYRGTTAHDRYLAALVQINGSTSIQSGQAVWLP